MFETMDVYGQNSHENYVWTMDLWAIYVIWKVVNVFCELCILLVNLYMWIVILWIVSFAFNWKVHKILFGGYHEFSSAWLKADENTVQLFSSSITGTDENMAQLFSSATTGADENQAPIFIGHWGRRK
jgi:hypothetical protein